LYWVGDSSSNQNRSTILVEEKRKNSQAFQCLSLSVVTQVTSVTNLLMELTHSAPTWQSIFKNWSPVLIGLVQLRMHAACHVIYIYIYIYITCEDMIKINFKFRYTRHVIE